MGMGILIWQQGKFVYHFKQNLIQKCVIDGNWEK